MTVVSVPLFKCRYCSCLLLIIHLCPLLSRNAHTWGTILAYSSGTILQPHSKVEMSVFKVGDVVRMVDREFPQMTIVSEPYAGRSDVDECVAKYTCSWMEGTHEKFGIFCADMLELV